MNEERKDYLGREFILNRNIKIEEVKKLNLQEIVFLIYSTKHFMKDNFISDIDLEEKIKIFKKELLTKINDAEELYVAYNTKTNYPHIDKQGKCWLFSTMSYAKEAQKHYSNEEIMLEIRTIVKDELINYCVKLYYLGIEELLIDNGQYTTTINRSEILPPPDYSSLPEVERPVENPGLQNSIIKFFQEILYKGAYRNDSSILGALEKQMLEEVKHARYLVPMQISSDKRLEIDENGKVSLDKGTKISFASVSDKNNNSWLPAFTDWKEFQKAFDKNIWQGNIMCYDDLLLISKKDGIVINCKGIPVQINEGVKNLIENI